MFQQLGLKDSLLKAIQTLGYKTPTPIQAQAIPQLLNSHKDLMALAQTGTGKTAAFGLPSLHLTDPKDRLPQTLVLCPTRELCIQIARDLEAFAQYEKDIRILAVYGGTSIENQIKDLKKGPQIIVGTPGRTHDLIRRNKLDISSISRVILDEADEMLSMGFKEELNAILDTTPAEKQTLLFSATMSKEIRNIAKNYMHNPEEIQVARENEAAKNVSHWQYVVQSKDRYALLKRIADMHPNIYAIIFCRTRRETKEFANKLMTDGYNADALHGDLSQAQRDDVMDRFRAKQLQLLVATDVAARGLDVDNLSHVINVGLPDDPEVYVHRSGRTGRAGNSGISIAIAHTRERKKLDDTARKANIQFEHKEPPTGEEVCHIQLMSLIDKIEKVVVDEKLIAPYLPAIFDKLAWLDRESLIKHFVSAEFNRFLSYYRKNHDLKSEKSNDRKATRAHKDVQYTSLKINVGRKQHVNPARIIGLVNEVLQHNKAQIGNIEINSHETFIEIEGSLAAQFSKKVSRFEFEGVPLFCEATNKAVTPKSGKRNPKKRRSHFDGSGFDKWMKPQGNSRKKKRRK